LKLPQPVAELGVFGKLLESLMQLVEVGVDGLVDKHCKIKAY
jgi:hypothetical protein